MTPFKKLFLHVRQILSVVIFMDLGILFTAHVSPLHHVISPTTHFCHYFENHITLYQNISIFQGELGRKSN